MSERMTVWGVGPSFTLFSVLYLALALAVHYLSHPLFVMRGIPYALLIVAGTLLLAIGVPIWAMASKEVDTAMQKASIRKLAWLEKVSLLCTAHTGCTTDDALAMKDWRAR
jgi:hypothetical protein